MAMLNTLRQQYHRRMCAEVIYMKENGIPSMADVGNKQSCQFSQNMLGLLPYPVSTQDIKGQTAGERLEDITKEFLENAFSYLQHIRPGTWAFSVHDNISNFDQYRHLSELSRLIAGNRALKAALGDYVISPDVVVARQPISDADINRNELLIDPNGIAQYTPLRAHTNQSLLLHAIVSCKWTLRSDRSQNARTEGLNLIRNRKGHTPHIVVVTGEPVPTRIASLALGTGDIDCVYHCALHELLQAITQTHDETAIETLDMMIDGRRLRDISDLPFDLAI